MAFDGSVAGVTGIWRRDLATGAIEQVAGGDAEMPSISESGQDISFTTNEGKSLSEITDGRPHSAKREAVNVYVRDMSKGPGQEGAFVVASASNGSLEPLAYNGAGTTLGSSAAGRSAISADGNEVAFVTTAVSDLVDGTAAEPQTPPLQVAVRYVDSNETALVSGEYDPESGATTGQPVSVQEAGRMLGAVYPGKSPSFSPPPAGGEWGKSPPPGASISADGSTVAWMGENIGRQARMLPDETPSFLYTEPLWRRIAPGSQTPTERVTGGSDPSNPNCAETGEAALPEVASAADPCQGPFEVTDLSGSESSGVWTEGGTGGGIGDFIPRLSDDGYTVAFISTALPISLGEDFGDHGAGEAADLYIANMHPGLTRTQALTPLSQLASDQSVAGADPITDFDISPDGTEVAFTTRRTEFPLGSPAYVSVPAAEPGMSELFDVDLRDDTLTRVTEGYEGGPSAEPHSSKLISGEEDAYGGVYTLGAQSPSFSANGDLIAFSSTADNLVLGDGNTPPAGPLDGSDAFVVGRAVFTPRPTPQFISASPVVGLQPAWRLGVTWLSRHDGTVLLYVRVPGVGTLRANARSAVLVKSRPNSRPARRARVASVSRRRTTRGHMRETVSTRTVATASSAIRSGPAGVVTLVLRLAKPYVGLATRSGGLTSSLSVTFTASGRHPLNKLIGINFRRVVPHVHAAHKARRAAPRRARRSR